MSFAERQKKNKRVVVMEESPVSSGMGGKWHNSKTGEYIDDPLGWEPIPYPTEGLAGDIMDIVSEYKERYGEGISRQGLVISLQFRNNFSSEYLQKNISITLKSMENDKSIKLENGKISTDFRWASVKE